MNLEKHGSIAMRVLDMLKPKVVEVNNAEMETFTPPAADFIGQIMVFKNTEDGTNLVMVATSTSDFVEDPEAWVLISELTTSEDVPSLD